jgi:flagellar hook-length control protein FliK
VVNVTSEVLASASFQGASTRAARPDPDQSAGSDSFAALVQSNTATANGDNRAQDRIQDRAQDRQHDRAAQDAPPPRRSDDPQPASDNRARDTAAADRSAPDQAARSDTNDRDAATRVREEAGADDREKTDLRDQAGAKVDSGIDASKPETTRTGESRQLSSGDDTAENEAADAAPDGAALLTADAVAVVLATAAAPAAIPTTRAEHTAAPLAIAAAAIAASAALASEAAPATPAPEAADADPAATANAKPEGRINAQGAIGQAVSAVAVSADATATTGMAQAAAVVAATPAATKPTVQIKNPIVAKEAASTTGEQEGAANATDAATAAPDADTIAVAPQPDAAVKPKTDHGAVEAVKADGPSNSAAPSTPHATAHSAPVDLGQPPVNSSGNGPQVAGAIQILPSSAPGAPASAALTATAASSAAVPLSGLAMEIAASALSGKTRFEIRLDPAELGRIDVRIDIDRHGQMTSHLTVERPETLSMLRQDANQLQRALDNAGLSTGDNGLQFSLRDQSSQGQNDQPNPNAQRLVVEEESVPAVVASSYGRMLGSSSGVDIRV